MAMPPPPPPPPMSHSRLEEGLRPGGLPPDEPVSGFVVFMNVTNTVTHLLLGAVTFCAFICINMVAFITNEVFSIEVSKFSAHVYLTVIGYVLLMSQAVLSLNPRKGWADSVKYPQKSKLYWSLQVLGSLLAVIGGIMAIVAVKEASDRPIIPSSLPGTITGRSYHLQSAHQIVGLVAMVLTTVSLVGGLVNLTCTSMVNNSMQKAVYSWAVTLTLIIAFIAICLAFDEFRALIFDTNANMAIALSVLVLVGMLTMIIGNMTVGVYLLLVLICTSGTLQRQLQSSTLVGGNVSLVYLSTYSFIRAPRCSRRLPLTTQRLQLRRQRAARVYEHLVA